MELICAIVGTSMISVAATLAATSGLQLLWAKDNAPKQLSLQTPRPLEVWKVFGLGEVLIQEVDEAKGVVAVTPEDGDEAKVWLSLEQVRKRGVMLNRSRGYTGSIDRVGRMRDRST